MKKLLFVMLSLHNGGAEKSLVNLLNEIPENKYEIDLLLFRKEGMFLPQVPEWVNIIDPPRDIELLYPPAHKAHTVTPARLVGTGFSRLRETERYRAAAFRWLHFYRKKIKPLEKKYDIAIAYFSLEVLYFVGDKVAAERKYVWIHNDYVSEKQPREYDFPYLEGMDGVVTVSNKCADILKEVFPEFKDKIHMIENITSSSVVRKRAEEYIPQEFTDRGNNIVSIGRLEEQKGFDLAIRAAEILKKRGISFKWFLIGNGSLENELRRQIERSGLREYVFLTGPKENPYPYLKHCTLFVQPSRFEGKSVVLDEAKIIGVPIVVTAYPTVQDQIEDGKEGVVADMTPAALADCMEQLLKDEELRGKLSDYLRCHEYGNRQELEKYIQLFDSK